jgi:hypothetical protein
LGIVNAQERELVIATVVGSTTLLLSAPRWEDVL